MTRKILVMGLSGSGKTTLTRALAPMLNAVVFNNDEVRANINRDLGFTIEDRVEQARRMGWLRDRVVENGGTAIDFICPTATTRAAFGEALSSGCRPAPSPILRAPSPTSPRPPPPYRRSIS
jgi:adenylylsulfate kinase